MTKSEIQIWIERIYKPSRGLLERWMGYEDSRVALLRNFLATVTESRDYEGFQNEIESIEFWYFVALHDRDLLFSSDYFFSASISANFFNYRLEYQKSRNFRALLNKFPRSKREQAIAYLRSLQGAELQLIALLNLVPQRDVAYIEADTSMSERDRIERNWPVYKAALYRADCWTFFEKLRAHSRHLKWIDSTLSLLPKASRFAACNNLISHSEHLEKIHSIILAVAEARKLDVFNEIMRVIEHFTDVTKIMDLIPKKHWREALKEMRAHLNHLPDLNKIMVLIPEPYKWTTFKDIGPHLKYLPNIIRVIASLPPASRALALGQLLSGFLVEHSALIAPVIEGVDEFRRMEAFQIFYDKFKIIGLELPRIDAFLGVGSTNFQHDKQKLLFIALLDSPEVRKAMVSIFFPKGIDLNLVKWVFAAAKNFPSGFFNSLAGDLCAQVPDEPGCEASNLHRAIAYYLQVTVKSSSYSWAQRGLAFCAHQLVENEKSLALIAPVPAVYCTSETRPSLAAIRALFFTKARKQRRELDSKDDECLVVYSGRSFDHGAGGRVCS